MKGDFSRLTFDPKKRYSGVRQQQGRVLLDADWNEQQDILDRRDETGTIDQLGRRAVPTPADFRLGVVQETASASYDLIIEPGRAYIEGVQAEQLGSLLRVAVSAADPQQIDVPTLVLDGRDLEVGQWVEIAASGVAVERARVTGIDRPAQRLAVDRSLAAFQAAGLSPTLRRLVTYTTQPDLPGVAALPDAEGLYVAYLDVWRRSVTALEDPDLVEVALGGPDTTTRVKTVWQLKLEPVASGATCADFPLGWTPAARSPAGRLQARVSGTTALENQLYRVEVHQGGDESSATFKWSRDNGAVVARVTAVGVQSISFEQAVRDEERQFEAGQWVEVIDDERLLAGEPGFLVEVTGVDGLELDILSWPTSTGAPPALGTNPVVRAWNSEADVRISTLGYLALEDGIEVRFAAGWFHSGDYWLIAARRDGNNVLWPTDDDGVPEPRRPRGVRHDFRPLALARHAGGGWTVESDCRLVVPPLAEVATTKVDRAGDEMTGKLTVLDDFEVTGGTALQGAVTVGGAVTLAQNLDLQGQLTVERSSRLRHLTTVEGNLDAQANLDVGGNARIAGTLGATGNATVGGALQATGETTLQSSLAVQGDVDLEQALNVDGATTLNHGLAVTAGGAAVNGDLTVNGEARSTVGGTDFFMVPRGGIIMWSGLVTDIPPGWQLCNGQNSTPDLRDRFVVGAGNAYPPGAQGGADQVALAPTQMPPHNHEYRDVFFSEFFTFSGAEKVDLSSFGRLGCGDSDRDNVGHALRHRTEIEGGGQAHENRPPYFALAYIMKL